MMTPQEYMEFTRTTRCKMAVDKQMVLPILCLGLAGETGEVCDKLKKHIRVGADVKTIDSDGLKKELGDILWYLTSITDELGFTLDDVINANVAKIRGRIKRNILYGSGDNR